MLILSLIFLLSSNAVTLRRDKSILYARIVITVLIYCFIVSIYSYYSEFQDKGLGLFAGLYQTSAITHIFHMFVILITALILQLNGFYLIVNSSNLSVIRLSTIFINWTYFNLCNYMEYSLSLDNSYNWSFHAHDQTLIWTIFKFKFFIYSLFFILIPQEWLNMANILALILFENNELP